MKKDVREWIISDFGGYAANKMLEVALSARNEVDSGFNDLLTSALDRALADMENDSIQAVHYGYYLAELPDGILPPGDEDTTTLIGLATLSEVPITSLEILEKMSIAIGVDAYDSGVGLLRAVVVVVRTDTDEKRAALMAPDGTDFCIIFTSDATSNAAYVVDAAHVLNGPKRKMRKITSDNIVPCDNRDVVEKLAGAGSGGYRVGRLLPELCSATNEILPFSKKVLDHFLDVLSTSFDARMGRE